MRKIDFGQAIGVIANFGVLAGILLLVFELNQNRALMAAQTRDSVSQSVVFALRDTAGNSVLTDIHHRANVGEQLTPTEQDQFATHMISWFRIWENQHYQYRVGLYDEAEFAAVRRGVGPSFAAGESRSRALMPSSRAVFAGVLR